MAATIRIGCGAGFAGDRLEPALVLAERGALDYLILECLAERTIALAQLRRRHDPNAGYDALLERRMTGLLPLIKHNGVRIVTNMGAANPVAAAKRIVALARDLGLKVKVAAVTGDDVLDGLDPAQPSLETGEPLASAGPLVSANAYLGIDAILPALDSFERALKADGDSSEFRNGIELIYRQFQDALQKTGVQPIAAVGQPFDPRIHEAIEMVDTAEVPDHQVLDELQRGYKYKDRLLRPAMVRVARNTRG